MSQYAFYIDTDKCIYCRSCVIACKDKNNLKPGRKFRKVHACSAGSWTPPNADGVCEPNNVFSYSVSLSCNHCAKPICVDRCPTGATGKRKDGIVFIDHDLCIGCKTCSNVCPYDAPSLDKETQKMDKCDCCRELVARGGSPVCVSACSMQAIEFGDIDKLRAIHPYTVQQVPPLPSALQTSPSLLIKPHSKYAGAAAVTSFNMPEEIQAYEK